MNKSLSVGEVLRFAWKAFKDNALILVLLTLFAFVIQFLFGIPCAVQEDAANQGQENVSALCSLFSLLHFIVNVLVTMGFATVGLIASGGEKVTFGDFFKKFNRFFHFLVAMILYSVIVVIGLILLIFPGIIWGLKYSMYPFMVLDKGAFGWTALKLSDQATYGYKWDLFGIYAALIIITIAGALAIGLGLFIAIPLTWIAQAYVYRKITEVGTRT